MKIFVQYSIDPLNGVECGRCPKLVYGSVEQSHPTTCALFGELTRSDEGVTYRSAACIEAERSFARTIREPMQEVHVVLEGSVKEPGMLFVEVHDTADKGVSVDMEPMEGANAERSKDYPLYKLGPFFIPWRD